LAERAPNGWASFARPATIVAFVSIPYLGQIAQPAHAAHFQHACNLPRATRLLNDFPGRVVLTDVNDTPEVLYRTGALTVGSLYHRNPAGFLRLRAAWRSGPSDTIPEAVSATDASLVLLCDHGVRSFMVADLPADTLMDRLAHDDMPPWLALLNRDEESGYALYAIRSGG
jgi:hypothetical protein